MLPGLHTIRCLYMYRSCEKSINGVFMYINYVYGTRYNVYIIMYLDYVYAYCVYVCSRTKKRINSIYPACHVQYGQQRHQTASIHTHIHTCTHTHACMHTHMHICMHAYTHAYIHTHMHTHTYTHTQFNT